MNNTQTSTMYGTSHQQEIIIQPQHKEQLPTQIFHQQQTHMDTLPQYKQRFTTQIQHQDQVITISNPSVEVMLKYSNRRLILVICLIICCTILIATGLSVGLYYYYKPKINQGTVKSITFQNGESIQFQSININKNMIDSSPININFIKTTYFKQKSQQRNLKQQQKARIIQAQPEAFCISGSFRGLTIKWCNNRLSSYQFNTSTLADKFQDLKNQELKMLEQKIISADLSVVDSNLHVIAIDQTPTSIIELLPDGLIYEQQSKEKSELLQTQQKDPQLKLIKDSNNNLQTQKNQKKEIIAHNQINHILNSPYLTEKFVEARIYWIRESIKYICIVLKWYLPKLQCQHAKLIAQSSPILRNLDTQGKDNRIVSIDNTNLIKYHRNNTVLRERKNISQFANYFRQNCYLSPNQQNQNLKFNCYGYYNYTTLSDQESKYKIYKKMRNNKRVSKSTCGCKMWDRTYRIRNN